MLISFFTALLLGFLGSMPVAGPIAFIVFARGMQGRYRDALLVAAGGGVAQGMLAMGAYLGAGHLIRAFGGLTPILQTVAAILLPILGVMLLRWRPIEPDEEMLPRKGKAVTGLLLGFSITMLNPTPLATWGATTAFLFTSGWYTFSPLSAPFFGLGVGTGKVLWFLLLLRIMRRYEGRFRSRQIAIVMRVLGVLLIAFGVHFAIQAMMSFGWLPSLAND